MKPHKHAELIKAWADGAEIEVYQPAFGRWEEAEPAWHTSFEYRIKPPEVAQWRKDMAQALEDGKVVEWGIGGWGRSVHKAKDFLNPEVHMDEEDYRIRPEPKPDVVMYACVADSEIQLNASTKDIVCIAGCDRNLKIVFDGTTGKPIAAEVLK